MKMRPVEAEVFHAFRRTDRQKGRKTDGGTDRHDEGNGRILKFCERAYNGMNWPRIK